MKNIFAGYYPKSNTEVKKIWEEAIFIFDTNVLLNLYKYSAPTRNSIFELIELLSTRVFLPYQVALEYNRNRNTVITAEETVYSNFKKDLIKIQESLQSKKSPFLSEDLDKKFRKILSEVLIDVEASTKNHGGYLFEDPIFERISVLFAGKILNKYSTEECEKIFTEGRERYKSKIPPGYMDEKDKPEEHRKFGDLVIWKQIIEKSKELDKAIIFITDEEKEDWWNKLGKRILGPRQELVEELKVQSGTDLLMYSSVDFLHFSQEMLNIKINQTAIDEIQALQEQDIEAATLVSKRISDLHTRIRHAENDVFAMKRELVHLDDYSSRLNEVTKSLLSNDPLIENQKAQLLHHQAELMQLIDTRNRYSNHLNTATHKRERLVRELDELLNSKNITNL